MHLFKTTKGYLITCCVLVCLVPVVSNKAEDIENKGAHSDASHPGLSLFRENCAPCHEGGRVLRAPDRANLSFMTPWSIYNALTKGVMQAQAAHLSDNERRAIAEYI